MSKRKKWDDAPAEGDAVADLLAKSAKRPTTEGNAPAPTAPALAGLPDIAAMQALLAAQIASASAILETAQAPAPAKPAAKKAAFHALRLDAQGREIDEQGNLVKQEGQVKTLSLNVGVNLQVHKREKKENPYLAHRVAAAAPKPVDGASTNGGSSSSSSSSSSNSCTTAELAGADDEGLDASGVDERIVMSSRDARAKRAFKFAEAGKYVEREEADRAKEERRIRSGASSGRRAPELVGSAVETSAEAGPEAQAVSSPPDEGNVPSMEWWDEAFLPKAKRDERKANPASAEEGDFALLQLANSKTYKYIQHPVPVKQLGGDRPDKAMPMFLTKKERKRIRKSRRHEVEQDKRDRQMMGLIPAPEPKFKLSNFMKILGDQAVADPSKVEQRVMQQIRQREITHEMRNLAAKLTPAQRREKKAKKALESAATARRIDVAAFRVKDLSNPRHRFKVDMNAQKNYLSGTVMLCSEGSVNLVYVEGGPKGIRKFTRLMLHRIKWDAPADDDANIEDEDNDVGDKDGDEGSGGEDSEDEEEEKVKSSASENRCDLIWQGVVAHRTYSGLKFQVRSSILSLSPRSVCHLHLNSRPHAPTVSTLLRLPHRP